MTEAKASLTPIVVFYPEGRCVEGRAGWTLLDAAQAAGVHLDSACGGQGTCGKCRVIIRLGEVDSRPSEHISGAEAEEGMVLACQSHVIGDVVAEVPAASQLGELQILIGGTETSAAAEVPLAQVAEVSLGPPSLDDPLADWERLARALGRALPDFETFSVDLDALRALPGAARAGQWRLRAAVADLAGSGQVFAIETARPGRPGYGVAVDIGTTTIAAHLVDLASGSAPNARACLNDQIAFGDDVISRIIAAAEPDGLRRLQQAVVRSVNSLVAQLADEQAIAPAEIVAIACAGNTTMTHLLLAVDPAAIRREPYVPAARAFPVLRAGEIGFDAHPAAPVYLAPCATSYVGGDTTAGVLATGMADVDELWLLVDLGTNGEIALGNRDWLTCCSCSAGPAFEGSGLRYGMHASLGAIERAEYLPDADRMLFSTIGGAKARGLCGSGLIDVLASLLEAGVVDRAGRIDLGFPSRRVRVREEQPEFVVVWGEEAGREDDIVLAEADIENLIRSKAAVYAGIAVLLESLGLRPPDLARLNVAGAFGNYLDVEHAVTIGLLPDIPLDKIRFVGNTSVAGARMALMSRAARARAQEIASRMTNFELSAVPAFMGQYVAGLFLPHTDLARFPSVAARVPSRSR